MRDGLLMVRDYVADGVHRWPVAPDTWTIEPQSGGWVEITTDLGVRLASFVGNTAGLKGLFLVLGPRLTLDAIAASMDLAAPLSTVWTQAKLTSGLARDVMRYWRDWRFDGRRRVMNDDGTSTVVTFTGEAYRVMADEGYSLPDPSVTPFPWNLDRNGQIVTASAAVMRIEANLKPALLASMGPPWEDNADAESTL